MSRGNTPKVVSMALGERPVFPNAGHYSLGRSEIFPIATSFAKCG
jgi:hypothetical protein